MVRIPSLACAFYVLDLFRSRGTKHDRVFSADEHFILYAHAEAMKVLGVLRISRYVDARLDSDDHPLL